MKKNFIKKQDFLLKLLSLALSIVLWAVVMDIDNPERNMRFDDVPVRVIGASQLKASTGLELIEGENTTVTVSLRGQSKSVGEVRASQITATVDISGLTEANEYDLPVTVSVSKSGVETNYVNPGKMHVRVAPRGEQGMFRSRINDDLAHRATATAQASRPRQPKRSPFSVLATIWRRWPRQLQPWMLPAAIPRWPTTNAG